MLLGIKLGDFEVVNGRKWEIAMEQGEAGFMGDVLRRVVGRASGLDT